MRRATRLAVALAGAAFLGAAVSPTALAREHELASSKVVNVLGGGRPLAADREAFVNAALRAPARGSCEVVSPDPGFVEEMLLDVSSIGAAGERKYERRVALVVGNGAYREPISSLANPPNDASSMAKMFRALGFTVYRAVDATEKSLDDCFARFRGDLEASDAAGAKADIALFFYAGHGVQLTSTADNEKRNYMLSVDAAVDPATGKAKGFRQIDRVLTEMRAHSKQAIFLYDACRNAPYGEGVVKEADGQSVRAYDASGAAPIAADESDRASQAGLFIAYATSPGKTADDAWGPQGSVHSPFTEALLKNLPTPGVIVEEGLLSAYYDVGELTSGRQTPWTSSSLTRRVRLNGAVDPNELQVRSAELAARSARARAMGLRGASVAAALKGLPRVWATGEQARPIAEARAELFRSVDASNVTFAGRDEPVFSAEFSRDGLRVLTAGGASADIWDAKTGAQLKTIAAGGRRIDSAAFSPNNRQIVTSWSNDRTVQILDTETGALLRTLEGHEGTVRSARFGPDGARVYTSSEDGTIRIWDAASGAELLALGGEPDKVFYAAMSGDGALIAGLGSFGAVRVWNAKSGKLQTSFETDDRQGVLGLAMSRDGARFAIGAGKDALVLDARSGAVLFRLVGHTDTVWSLDFSVDGSMLATGAADRTAKIWNMKTGELIRTISGHTDRLMDARFSPGGGRLVTASWDRTARSWSVAGDAPLQSLNGHKVGVASAGYSPDGKSVVTGGYDDTARIWEAATGALLRTLSGENPVLCVGFDPGGARISTASSDGAKIWDAGSGRLLKTLSIEGEGADCAAFSPDGAQLATAAGKKGARVWDARTGTLLLTTKEGHQSTVWSVAFSGDGGRLVTGSWDNTARVWDARTGAAIATMLGHENWVMSAAFSANGARVVTASADRTAKLWNAETGALLRTFEGHLLTVQSAEFSRDDALVLTASDDQTAVIWDAETGEPLRSFGGPSTSLNVAAFSPDGSRIVAGGSDAVARIWSVGLYGPELLKAAYDLLTDELRAEVERERIRYWEVAPELMQ